MTASADAIGFFTVDHCQRMGWTGGYLLLNAAGRPLEFHCTLPVRPTRTHEILYGPTLRQYIICDVIGQALLPRARTQPQLICCNQPEGLQLDQKIPVPVGLVVEAAEREEGPILDDVLTGYQPLEIAAAHCMLRHDSIANATAWQDRFADFPDLLEPFGRILEAIKEAQMQLSRSAA